MNRRRYLAVVGATVLAGCSSSDEPEPVDTTTGPDEAEGATGDGTPTNDESTGTAEEDTSESGTTEAPRSAEARVGTLVEGDAMHLVVEEVERGADLGQFSEPDSGNEFLRVSMALKNVSDDYRTVSNLLQTRVRDDEDYQYEQSLAVAGQTYNDGQFAPGEVERGNLVFEVPTDASGLRLVFDFDPTIFGGLDRAVVDLESEASSVHELEQDLAVDVYEPGRTIEYGDVQIVVNEARTEGQLDQFTAPDEGNEYVVVDVSITNDTGEQKQFSTVLQMMLKDGDGYTYQEDIGAMTALDRAFDEGTPLSDGETRRGELAYQVPEGTAPLYWVFEFQLFATGDKTFWQLR